MRNYKVELSNFKESYSLIINDEEVMTFVIDDEESPMTIDFVIDDVFVEAPVDVLRFSKCLMPVERGSHV